VSTDSNRKKHKRRKVQEELWLFFTDKMKANTVLGSKIQKFNIIAKLFKLN